MGDPHYGLNSLRGVLAYMFLSYDMVIVLSIPPGRLGTCFFPIPSNWCSRLGPGSSGNESWSSEGDPCLYRMGLWTRRSAHWDVSSGDSHWGGHWSILPPFYHLTGSSTSMSLNASSYIFVLIHIFQTSQMMHLAGQLRIRVTELESEAWVHFNTALAG